MYFWFYLCLKRLPTDSRTLPKGLMSSQFCAASAFQDTCEGDSGGPLQIERPDVNDDLIPLIVGIVSFGTPCINNSTGVYTRVSSYKVWIEQETGQSFDYSACARTMTCRARAKINSKILNFKLDETFSRVGLLWNESDPNAFHCGATMIHYRFALTSAYCARLKQEFPKYIIVDTNSEVVLIESVLIHPEYRADNPQNDLALLMLAKYLNLNYELRPACLRQRNGIHYGTMYFSVYSSRFQTLKYFRKEDYERYVINARMETCSSAVNRRKNLLCGPKNIKLIPKVCKIDHGGPILNAAGYKNIFGVVSSLSRSCDKELVGVRITPHLDWITKTIAGNIKDQKKSVSKFQRSFG